VWHLPLLGWTAFVIGYAWRRRVPLPREWWPLVGLGAITMAGYTLSSIVARYMIPTAPLWWLTTWAWFAAIRERSAGRVSPAS
jgi:hypothetical protein